MDKIVNQIKLEIKSLESSSISFKKQLQQAKDEIGVDFVRHADEALYQSKKAGRNMVTGH